MPLSLYNEVELFLFIFLRMTILLSFLPVFRDPVIPVHFRVGFSTAIALLLLPSISNTMDSPQISSIWHLLFLVTKEVILAFMIGFLFDAIFVAVNFAGGLLSMQMGQGMLQVPDPILEGTMGSGLGALQSVIFTILFLSLNGHYYLIIAMQKSFELIPPGDFQFATNGFLQVVLLTLSRIFEIALRMAAPVLGVLKVTEVSLGVIAKSMPQMNIYMVGAPLKTFVGFFSFIFALPAVFSFFHSSFLSLYRDIWKLLHALAV